MGIGFSFTYICNRFMQLKSVFHEYISHMALLIVGMLNFSLNQHTVKNFEDVYFKRTNVITAMVCVWTAKP